MTEEEEGDACMAVVWAGRAFLAYGLFALFLAAWCFLG